MKNKIEKTLALTVGFVGSVSAAFAAPSGWSTSNYSGMGLPGGSIYNIISNTVMWVLGIFGFIAIIGFVISGIMYLTSAGDDAAMKKAKNQMTWSIIGVVVGLVGYIVIYAVNSMLGGISTSF
ncbi:MAG: hypothetical protein WC831_04575 [Parcubacteria group bacterium]|jgi:hypothetical protein